MNDSTTETGYTRAQLADAVDLAHAALHTWEEQAGPGHPLEGAVIEAHEALHSVGAGMPRSSPPPPDPEAQRIVRELIAESKREIPCGHTVADLVSGTEPDGRLSITKCGACLGERQPEIVAKNRARAAQRAALVAAIRTFTVDGPGDDPNGPTEAAYAAMLESHLKMLDAVLPYLTADNQVAALALRAAGDAISRYGELMANDVQAIRVAADAFFGGDFRKPAPQ